jgi:hypothetical protein
MQQRRSTGNTANLLGDTIDGKGDSSKIHQNFLDRNGLKIEAPIELQKFGPISSRGFCILYLHHILRQNSIPTKISTSSDHG